MITICSGNIDWDATGSMLQGIGTFAGVGAVIWGAFFGSRAWKEQKRAERRLEMAERILTATHKGRSALAHVRGAMMWGHELHAAEEKLKEDKDWVHQPADRKKRLITAQAFYNRLNRTESEQLSLDDCLPMARALFSEDLEKSLENLRHQFWLVQVDVDCYIDDDGSDVDFTKKLRRGMYDTTPRKGEENEISNAIAEAVSRIERICAPALRLDPI